MKINPIPMALMLFALNAHALDAAQQMNDLTWEKRVLVIFAPDAQDPGLELQNKALEVEQDGLSERHMTVIRVYANGLVSIDGKLASESITGFHEHFGVDRDRFRIFLVGKDGGVKLERDEPVSTGELFSLIDSMPMRQHEMLQNG